MSRCLGLWGLLLSPKGGPKYTGCHVFFFFFFFLHEESGGYKITNSDCGGGGTNLLLMTIGHISNVWSIKPNFKFKIPKCDQNSPWGHFLILLRVELHAQHATH